MIFEFIKKNAPSDQKLSISNFIESGLHTFTPADARRILYRRYSTGRYGTVYRYWYCTHLYSIPGTVHTVQYDEYSEPSGLPPFNPNHRRTTTDIIFSARTSTQYHTVPGTGTRSICVVSLRFVENDAFGGTAFSADGREGVHCLLC